MEKFNLKLEQLTPLSNLTCQESNITGIQLHQIDTLHIILSYSIEYDSYNYRLIRVDGDRLGAVVPNNIKGIIMEKEGTIMFNIDQQVEIKYILLHS